MDGRGLILFGFVPYSFWIVFPLENERLIVSVVFLFLLFLLTFLCFCLVLDALLVGSDALLRARESDPKLKLKVFLITGGYSFADTTNLDELADKYIEHDVGFNLIGVNFFEPNEDEDELEDTRLVPSTKKRNEKSLHRFVTKTNGAYYGMEEGLHLLSQVRLKTVRQTPVYGGSLTIGSVSIGVKGFIKTKMMPMPTMKKMSAESQQLQQQKVLEGEELYDIPSMDVKMDRSYKNLMEPDKTFPKSTTLLKGWRYGKTLVKMSKEDLDRVKYKVDRCMIVVGFVHKSKVPRHYFMGQPELIVGENNEAGQALASLVEAMMPLRGSGSTVKEEHDSVEQPPAPGGGLDSEERVALVRYAKNKNGAAPVLACLVPMVKRDRYHGFYLHRLPFAEDLRKYDWPGLSRAHVRPELCPSEEQLSVMERLVSTLDLDHGGPGGTELLKPKDVYNPAVLQLYQVLRHRASKVPETVGGVIDPSCVQLFPTNAAGRPIMTVEEASQLPPLDSRVKATMDPPMAVWGKPEAQQAVAAAQSNVFRSEWVVPRNKGKKRLWDEQVAQQAFANAPDLMTFRDVVKQEPGDDGGDKGKDDDDGKNKRGKKKGGGVTMNQLLHGDHLDVIGTTTPVQDFEKIISRRDRDMVDTALAQMKAVIQKLVQDSIQGHLYDKALECAVALRKGCVVEDEPEDWNDFLRLCRSEYKMGMHRDFWARIVRAQLSLISDDECALSSIGAAEAIAFLHEDAGEPVDNAAPAGMELGDEEDLFDMIE